MKLMRPTSFTGSMSRTLSPAVVGVMGMLSIVISAATCVQGGQKSVSDSLERRNIEIPMRDGQKLAADVLLPSAEGKFPTVFILTPYNREFGGGPLPSELMAHKAQDREHYAYVIVDWRGRYGSKEAAEGVKRIDNGKDGYDVVEWIAQQPWSNGKVGMWGVSAVGSVQYDVAMERPPHLTCIVPASANVGIDYNQFYYGGVLQLYYFNVFEAVGHGAGDLIKDHDTLDDTWKAIDARFDVSRVDLPVLFVTGWYDTHPGLKIETFQKIRTAGKRYQKDMKLLIGPWLHTRLGGPDQGELHYPQAEGESDRQALRFFDYYLRGLDNGWEKEPVIRYFQMGENEWKTADSWPPRTETVSFYLERNRRLSAEPPSKSQPDSFVYDPASPTPTIGGNLIELPKAKMKIPIGAQDLRPVESRSDVVVYSTEPLERDLAIAGDIEATLYTSSDQRDTDFAVRLTDVYPDGRSILVTDGIQRMRYRHSLEKAELIDPGKVYEVTVKLPPTATTFLKGHRVRIVVGSANWPAFEANPNTDRPRLIGPKMRVARNEIYHDPDHRSAIMLPVNESRKGSGR
jgi:uncharacterized protein